MKSDCIHFAVFTSGGCGWALTNVSVYLASGLALKGHSVDLVTLNTPKAEIVHFYKHVDGISQVSVYSLGVKHTKTCIPSLVRYYRVQKPDVMFSQLTYTNIVAIIAKYLAGLRTVNILLEGTIISKVGTVDSKRDRKLKLVPLLVTMLYPYGDGLVAKSHDVLRDLEWVVGKRLQKLKIAVLPNPYNLERFRLLANEPVDHPWLTDKTVPVIISAGRFWEQKGFDILIRAFAGVVSKTPCRLIILGDGPERPELQALVAESRVAATVDMPGWVDNPWKYMARSILFVLPSRWEGWPSALVEAMACGLPVITTDCPGGGKEMVESGSSGLIVPINNIERLKEAMLKLLEDAPFRASLSMHAYQCSLNYDYTVVTHDYLTFAKSLLKEYNRNIYGKTQ
jgi:glycosyltransferase involved in cell wall biosynthesis